VTFEYLVGKHPELIGFQTSLIKKYGELGKDLTYLDEFIAESRTVNKVLLPVGTVVRHDSEIMTVESVDGNVVTTKVPGGTTSHHATMIEIVETKKVYPFSIHKATFQSVCGLQVYHSNVVRVARALAHTVQLDVYNDNGTWRMF
jgi:hypothetical protein